MPANTPRSRQPLVTHHVVGNSPSITAALRDHLRLDAERITLLLKLGAVYCDGVRVPGDCAVRRGQHLEVYRQPARFAVEAIDWRASAVAEQAEFLVVCKPPGIPVQATPDNAIENTLHQMRLAWGEDLGLTHRLDTPVGGLMVLARTPDFQREFNRLLAERRVRKVYRAILDRRPPLGTLRHYLAPEGNLPRRASRSPAPGWEIAELSIHSAAELRFAHTDHVYFDAAIELHTGRLHQIRAQLAAAGCPIAGDKRYGSTVRFSRLKVGPGIGLFSAQIAWPRAEGSALRFTLDPPWGKQAESG